MDVMYFIAGIGVGVFGFIAVALLSCWVTDCINYKKKQKQKQEEKEQAEQGLGQCSSLLSSPELWKAIEEEKRERERQLQQEREHMVEFQTTMRNRAKEREFL